MIFINQWEISMPHMTIGSALTQFASKEFLFEQKEILKKYFSVHIPAR